MSIFIGNEQEFNNYIGPKLRNKVQYLTKSYKKKIGKCEECGSSKKLEAAHMKGHERPQIINKLLQQFKVKANYNVKLEEFETLFLEYHQPVENVIKVLCSQCHRLYDNPSPNCRTTTTTSYSMPNTRTSLLPIKLTPDDHDEFKRQLIENKKASIKVCYVNGTSEEKVWNARKFKKTSDVFGNLRSRPGFRQGVWQKNNIQRIHVRIIKR